MNIVLYLSFLVYMVFWLQIPGMLIAYFVLPKKLKLETWLLGGFFLGFTGAAILYAVESLTGIAFLLECYGPIASVAGIVLWFMKKRPALFAEGEKFRPTHGILMVVILVISYFAFTRAWGGAKDRLTTYVYHDYLFHTGNIVALSRSFPAIDLRVNGLTFYYHYFMELLFAMHKHIFGYTAFDTYMVGTPFVAAYPLALALGIVGRRIAGDKEVSEGKFFLYSVGSLVCCVSLTKLTIAYYNAKLLSWTNNHIFTNANALGLGLCILVLVLDLLVSLRDFEFRLPYCIAFVLLGFSATGFKGPIGLLLVAIAISVFIIESLIERKAVWGRLAYALSLTAGFLISYVTVVGVLNGETANNKTTKLTGDGALEVCYISRRLAERFGVDYYSQPWRFICLFLCAVFIMGPLVVPFIAFIVMKLKELIKDKTVGNIFDWYAIGSILIAEIGLCTITIDGLSQSYMLMCATPLVFYCAFSYVKRRKLKYSVVSLVTVLTLLAGSGILVNDMGYYRNQIRENDYTFDTPNVDRLDRADMFLMDAYSWLYNNTSEDALIATDIQSTYIDTRKIYFYCGAFSERQCYIEGYDYSDIAESKSAEMLAINSQFYSGDAEIAEAALSTYGINYLVVTERGHTAYEAPTERLKLVYENNKIKIYEFI